MVKYKKYFINGIINLILFYKEKLTMKTIHMQIATAACIFLCSLLSDSHVSLHNITMIGTFTVLPLLPNFLNTLNGAPTLTSPF